MSSKKINEIVNPAAKSITLPITAELAEELLISLCYRAKQDGIRGTALETDIVSAGRYFSKIFEKEFNFQKGVFEHHYNKNIIVRVRSK